MLFCFSTSHQFRVTALLAYGLLVACCVVGIKGLGVVLGHLGLSLAVAQLCNPALSWSCALLLLSTLHIPPLQEIQVSRTSFYSISCMLSLSLIHPLQEIHTSLPPHLPTAAESHRPKQLFPSLILQIWRQRPPKVISKPSGIKITWCLLSQDREF